MTFGFGHKSGFGYINMVETLSALVTEMFYFNNLKNSGMRI
jgi:hypothetical protein